MPDSAKKVHHRLMAVGMVCAQSVQTCLKVGVRPLRTFLRRLPSRILDYHRGHDGSILAKCSHDTQNDGRTWPISFVKALFHASHTLLVRAVPSMVALWAFPRSGGKAGDWFLKRCGGAIPPACAAVSCTTLYLPVT